VLDVTIVLGHKFCGEPARVALYGLVKSLCRDALGSKISSLKGEPW
jgi:hypothetical protein